MPEPAFTIDRYGGTYSMRIAPWPWWHPRGVIARLRARRRGERYMDAFERQAEVERLADEESGHEFFRATNAIGHAEAPVDVTNDALRALRRNSVLGCCPECGVPESARHLPGCVAYAQRVARSGRFDD